MEAAMVRVPAAVRALEGVEEGEVGQVGRRKAHSLVRSQVAHLRSRESYALRAATVSRTCPPGSNPAAVRASGRTT